MPDAAEAARPIHLRPPGLPIRCSSSRTARQIWRSEASPTHARHLPRQESPVVGGTGTVVPSRE